MTITSTPQLVLASDIDGTLTGDDAALRELLDWLFVHEIPLICATGRHYQSAMDILAVHGIPEPIALVTDVGCEIRFDSDRADSMWNRLVTRGWDRDLVLSRLSEIPAITRQDLPGASIRIGYLIDRSQPVEQVALDVQSVLGPCARVVISGHCLDVVPAVAGKGPAVRYALRRLGLDPAQAVAAGDSGNDADMLTQLGAGIIVGNASPELAAVCSPGLYRARSPYAAGILEGLRARIE